MINKKGIIDFINRTKFPCEVYKDTTEKDSCSLIDCPLCLIERNDSSVGVKITKEIKLCIGLMKAAGLA